MRSEDSPRKSDDIELGSPAEEEKKEADEMSEGQEEETRLASEIDKNKENTVQDDPADGIQFDYSKLIISDTSKESRSIKWLIDTIPDGKKLLKHPVIEAFIMMKWVKLFWFWYIWVALKLFFMAFFLSYGFLNNQNFLFTS